MKAIYVRQLSNREMLKIYQKVKSVLINQGVFSYEAIEDALDSKICDLEFQEEN